VIDSMDCATLPIAVLNAPVAGIGRVRDFVTADGIASFLTDNSGFSEVWERRLKLLSDKWPDVYRAKAQSIVDFVATHQMERIRMYSWRNLLVLFAGTSQYVLAVYFPAFDGEV
jgi:hypothetical protein